MKYIGLFACLLFFFAGLAIPDDADAARMGGGRSFGSQPSMSRPAQRPATRQQTPQAQGAPSASRPGMFGGMGGLFGGLLAGTLLGSLLSGNGFGGGGGGFMDIILIAILAFLGWKLYTRFRNQKAQAGQGGGIFPGQQNTMQRGNTSWDQLSGGANTYPQEPPKVDSWRPINGATPPNADANVDIPAGFDQDEFLKGAKMAYARLQKSWDNRDLQDISQFATKSVMKELTLQAQEDPRPSHTEILMVNAELAGVEPEGDNLRAQVYFDVLMREDPAQAAPGNVREIWHFLRIGQNGNWKLDGIQQVE